MAHKQEKMFKDKLDPPLVKVADRVVELTDEKRKVKERLDVQTKSLIGLMNQAGKSNIRHGGFLIKLSTTKAKDKVTVQQVQAKKK